MAPKESENGLKGFEFRKPDNRTKWQTFINGVYNPSTKEILGRTGKSWGQLFLFYSIFYIVLAALFAICMQVLLANLNDTAPRWTLDESLIGTNPGLGFRPISNRTEEGSLIWYNQKNETSIKKWVALVDEFLMPYMADQTGRNFEKCDFDKPANESKVCQVDVTEFGSCSKENSYGYNSSSPCVFLKLNKIYGWEPEYYTKATEEMREHDSHFPTLLESKSGEKHVWVSCRGEKPVDKENARDFKYFPSQGFPSYYFPYKNVKNYLSPIVAIQILNPTASLIVSIECRAWADNIIYQGGDLQREGSVHFEILRDDK